jgi:hypothetical protein
MKTFLAFALLLQAEQAVPDDEFDRAYAKAVRAYQAAEARAEKEPAAALRALEADVLPALPKLVETRLVVKYTRGATRGSVRETVDFHPWRLAGRCALAAGDPAKAAAYLEKSPSSAALLAEARKAAAAPKPPAPLQKPASRVDPLLSAGDFAGALAAARAETPGQEERVRAEAVRFQRERAACVAEVLPRLAEETFRTEHVEPCLLACAKVPPDLETDELRWVRELGDWTRRRDPAGLDRLALSSLRFPADYHAACRLAQEGRLRELDALAEQARLSALDERPAILERFDAAERAWRELSARKDYADLRESLARIRAKLPVDAEALARARAGAPTAAALRALARDLEGLWVSPERARLAVADQKDLALHLALARASVLLLDGRSVDEAARDTIVADAFRAAGPLPADVSPRLRAVAYRVR